MVNENTGDMIEQFAVKAKTFYSENTMVFVKTLNANGYPNFYNGFITKVEGKFFTLRDAKTNVLIPVFFMDLCKVGAIFEASRNGGVRT